MSNGPTTRIAGFLGSASSTRSQASLRRVGISANKTKLVVLTAERGGFDYIGACIIIEEGADKP